MSNSLTAQIWQLDERDGRPAVVCHGPHGVRATLYTVSSTGAPRLAGELFSLAEWVEYRMRLDVTGVALEDWQVTVGGRPARRDPDGFAVITFQNALGLSTLSLSAMLRTEDGQVQRWNAPPLNVEVISPRLAALIGPSQTYPYFVARLVAELGEAVRDLSTPPAQAALGGLPFAFAGTTAYPVETTSSARGDATAVAPDAWADSTLSPTERLFFYHFFVRYGAALEAAAHIVLRSPHHRRISREELRRPDEITTLDPGMLPDLLLWHGVLAQNKATVSPDGVPQLLLRQQVSDESSDTLENRFALAFLRLMQRKAAGCAAWLANYAAETPGWATDAAQAMAAIANTLAELLAAPFWENITVEVGQDPATLVRYPSQALLKRPGYAELANLWQIATSAARPAFFRRLDRAIAARDVATLYEYWAYFALARRLSHLLGIQGALTVKSAPLGGLGYDTRITFEVAPHYDLVFNHTFRGRTGNATSYSRPFRPDFALLKEGQAFLVFDAKLRGRISDFGLSGAEALSDDLAKMHAYRDALGVRAALALYPASRNDSRFYDEARHMHIAPADSADLLAALLTGQRQGVGALGFLPDSLSVA